MKRKILIIGGTRFLGPKLVELLTKNGDDITCFNRGNNYGYRIPKGVKQVTGDREIITDLKKLKDISFDLVYDLCCYTPNQASKIIRVLAQNTRHFIFLSTAAVYKKTSIYPLKEDSSRGEWDSFGDYGTNKSKAEDEFIKNAKKNNTKLTILRPVYILGKDNYFNRENYYFSRILKKQKILIPGNGNALIQFCFVDETASIFYNVPLLQKKQTEILNVGGDECITIQGFVELCASIVNKKPIIHHLDTRQYGFDEEQFRDELYPFPNSSLVLSNVHIKGTYGIQFNNLNEGLKNIYKHWIKNWNGGLMRSKLEIKIIQDIGRNIR